MRRFRVDLKIRARVLIIAPDLGSIRTFSKFRHSPGTAIIVQ